MGIGAAVAISARVRVRVRVGVPAELMISGLGRATARLPVRGVEKYV